MGRGKSTGRQTGFIPISSMRARPAPPGLDIEVGRPPIDKRKLEALRDTFFYGCTPEGLIGISRDLNAAVGVGLTGVWDGPPDQDSGDLHLFLCDDKGLHKIPPRLWNLLMEDPTEAPTKVREVAEELEEPLPVVPLEPYIIQYDEYNWYFGPNAYPKDLV